YHPMKWILISLLIPILMCKPFDALEPLAKARIAYYEKDYVRSIDFYQQAIQLAGPHEKGIYYMELASCYIKMEQAPKAVQQLQEAFQMGWLSPLGIDYEVRLADLSNHSSWPSLQALEKQAFESYFQQCPQSELARDLVRRYRQDQYQRYRIVEILGPKHGWRSQEVMQAYRQQSQVDQQNQAVLDSLVATNGFPKQSEVGWLAAEGAFHIVQHASLTYQQRYLPLLRTQVETKELAADHLAFLEDRILVNEGKAQRYGTQMQCKGDTCWVRPIEAAEQVDERRLAIGLLPMEWHLKIRHLKDGRVYVWEP
ncbi:MAG: DUF6624 domain-containing protein, partial [Bacteroidota bacterium]